MSFWINCDLTFSNKGTQSWYIYMKTKTLTHINELLYNEIWVVEEWVELFCNWQVLSVDLATSSGSYKCEITSILGVCDVSSHL